MSEGAGKYPGPATYEQLAARLVGAQAEWDQLQRQLEAVLEVAREIQEIMKTYRQQEESDDGVGTPGGLEHMGDVWRLLRKWEETIVKAERPEGGEMKRQQEDALSQLSGLEDQIKKQHWLNVHFSAFTLANDAWTNHAKQKAERPEGER